MLWYIVKYSVTMKMSIPYKAWSFLTKSEDVNFSRRNLYYVFVAPYVLQKLTIKH